VIEAGSQRGLSDIGAVRTAGPESSFVMPMANGTYFVRVAAVDGCGSGKPTADARVQVSGSVPPGVPNPAVILSTVNATRERLGSTAFVRVMGQVRNGWSAAPAALVTVAAKYEGRGGALGVSDATIAAGVSGRLRRSGLVTDTVLPPGGTGCFVLFASFAQARVTGLELTASAAPVAVEEVSGNVDVEAPTFAADEFDGLVVAGRLAGAVGPGIVRELWVEARDADGRLLDCRGSPVNGSTFRSVTEAPFSQSRMVRWWLSETPASDPAGVTQEYANRRNALSALLANPEAAPQDVAAARDALRREVAAIETR
jgi:hypothetical protein